jgi:hypothetical protein
MSYDVRETSRYQDSRHQKEKYFHLQHSLVLSVLQLFVHEWYEAGDKM